MRFDADKLRRVIEEQGLTSTDVSTATGLHETSLWHALERGTCRYWTLDRVAVALGRHPSEFEVAS